MRIERDSEDGRGAPLETEEGGDLATPHRINNFASIQGELERLENDTRMMDYI